MKGSGINKKAGRFAPKMKLIPVNVHTTVGCNSFSFFSSGQTQHEAGQN